MEMLMLNIPFVMSDLSTLYFKVCSLYVHFIYVFKVKFATTKLTKYKAKKTT